jgi:hypothetical protein
MRLALLCAPAAALIIHVAPRKSFCATFPDSEAFSIYNITTEKDVLLARWAMTGEEEGAATVQILSESSDVVHKSAERESEVVTDVPAKRSFRFCVDSEVHAELVFALHRGPKMSELAEATHNGIALHELTGMLSPPKEQHVAKAGAFENISHHLSATEVTRAMLVDMYRISRDLKERQEQMQAMDDTLDDISEKTTWHVTVWAGVQSAGLVLISFFQIYYLKSFFEVKQLI